MSGAIGMSVATGMSGLSAQNLDPELTRVPFGAVLSLLGHVSHVMQQTYSWFHGKHLT